MSMNVGFIGVGGVSKRHLENLSEMSDVRIAAVCDIDEEKATTVAEKYKCNAHTDFNKMIEEEDLTAVFVCVPPFAHGAPEEAAIEAGLHLFVEKPVDIDLDRAKEISEKIEKAGLITSAGYQDRYLDIIDRLKGYLRDRKPGIFMGYWMGGLPKVHWWRRKDQSGGQAVEQTTHIFDTARYLFGEVDRVYAGGTAGLMTEVEDYNIEDASAVTLHFNSGLVGVIFSACFLSVGRKSGIDIFCKDCIVEYKERTSIKIQLQGKEPEEYQAGKEYLVEIDRAFIDAIQKQDQSLVRSTYADAVRSLELSLAANISMETGQPVDIREY